MIISIDDSLSSLYEELKSMGYEIYKLSENIVSDTVIYSEGINNSAPLYSSFPCGSGKGVFLVNGDNKNCAEILGVINRRAYSSLF